MTTRCHCWVFLRVNRMQEQFRYKINFCAIMNTTTEIAGLLLMKNQDPEVHYTEVYCESKLNVQTHNMANGGTPGWGRQHHSQRDPPLVPSKRLPDWASLELSPSVESCGCGLGPSPVRLG